MQTIKEAAKTTGEIDPEVLEGDAEQYKYYASYWAKLPMPLLGLHVIKLKHKENDGEAIVDEDGLKVLAVIKGSPAFKAGLKRGDVLLKLGSIDVQTPELLSKAVGRNAGKTIEITYKRQTELTTTKATLNGH